MEEKHKNKESKCPYCGDAPVSHAFTYFSNVMTIFFDATFSNIFKKIPKFIINAVDKFLRILLRVCVFLKIIKLSSDIERATTLRSRVIWNEAVRRGIKMEQLVIFGKYTDNYRAKIGNRYIYFNSLPVPEEQILFSGSWDDKFFLKEALKNSIVPVPKYAHVPFWESKQKIFFENFQKPMIVKPRMGSRGRHTTTNINTWEEFKSAVRRARQICPQVVAEEDLSGYVCRATCVGGKLSGFYRAESAIIVGNGQNTILELIENKNKNRLDRVEEIKINEEMKNFVKRSGFELDSVLPAGQNLKLSYRTGRYFGGETKEMFEYIHPSFVPIIEEVAKITKLPVIGLDCIVPDPEKHSEEQRWGVIECNTLPFIDLHYFALSGKPQNIAGMIWDFWN